MGKFAGRQTNFHLNLNLIQKTVSDVHSRKMGDGGLRLGQVKGGKWNVWELEIQKAEKSLRPRRLSGEKGLPQRRGDVEGMAPAERGPTELSVVN